MSDKNYKNCIHYFEDVCYTGDDFWIMGLCSKNGYKETKYCCIDITECKEFEEDDE